MSEAKTRPTTSVDEALQLLLDHVKLGEPRTLELIDCLGLVLAKPVLSRERHPSENTSAMDGYALRTEDLRGATTSQPVHLSQEEDIQAGAPPRYEISSGQASRISTGALVPKGADAVVMREHVKVLDDGRIEFSAPAKVGLNIRFAGEHLQENEVAVEAGALLRASELGMAAYLGYPELCCFPKVKVGVLATGSELVDTASQLDRGQIRDSNSLALASALTALGCEVSFRARVPDTADALDEALGKAFEQSDVVLTSGGISAGWHDLVRKRIEKLGGRFEFHKLRMRPGKPVAFGVCGKSHFFCLPGNPVSTLVTFEIFVKPALLKMMGRSTEPQTLHAELTETIHKKADFTIFYRGVVTEDVPGNFKVKLTGPQGSHMLRSMVAANVLIRADEGLEVLPAGSRVTLYKLF